MGPDRDPGGSHRWWRYLAPGFRVFHGSGRRRCRQRLHLRKIARQFPAYPPRLGLRIDRGGRQRRVAQHFLRNVGRHIRRHRLGAERVPQRMRRRTGQMPALEPVTLSSLQAYGDNRKRRNRFYERFGLVDLRYAGVCQGWFAPCKVT